MLECIELGSAPYEEECAQYKTAGYRSRARKECRAFCNQIVREFGDGTNTNYIELKYYPYDEDGGYYEVVVYYDPNNEQSAEYAFNIERNLPRHWDDQSKLELGIVS